MLDAMDGEDADGEEVGGVLREKVEAKVAALVEVVFFGSSVPRPKSSLRSGDHIRSKSGPAAQQRGSQSSVDASSQQNYVDTLQISVLG